MLKLFILLSVFLFSGCTCSNPEFNFSGATPIFVTIDSANLGCSYSVDLVYEACFLTCSGRYGISAVDEHACALLRSKLSLLKGDDNE